MPKYTGFSAAIFDMDDTLLSNNPPGSTMGLHEKSRLRAAHAVGKKHGIPALAQLSAADNYGAFFEIRRSTRLRAQPGLSCA